VEPLPLERSTNNLLGQEMAKMVLGAAADTHMFHVERPPPLEDDQVAGKELDCSSFRLLLSQKAEITLH
jgi:hypothetical protein